MSKVGLTLLLLSVGFNLANAAFSGHAILNGDCRLGKLVVCLSAGIIGAGLLALILYLRRDHDRNERMLAMLYLASLHGGARQ